MKALLGNSALPNYVKLMAAGVLVITYLAALYVAVNSYIQSGNAATLPQIVIFVLGTGLGLSLNVLGLHQGASLIESAPIPPNTSSVTTRANVTTGETDASATTT